jgi:hypothetical protein
MSTNDRTNGAALPEPAVADPAFPGQSNNLPSGPLAPLG